MHGSSRDFAEGPQEFDAAATSAESGAGFYRWLAGFGLAAGALVAIFATGFLGVL